MSSTGKADLRARLRAERQARSPRDRSDAAHALAAAVLALPELTGLAGRAVAGYVSMGTEPGTGPLLDGLLAAGIPVILPVLRPDLDLDWAAYEGDDALAPGRPDRPALREPTGPRLGVDAVAGAGLVVVPALAVGPGGVRLGQGGGSYDRALVRVPAGVPLVALLHDGEVLDAVPAEPHDRAVTLVVTPSRVVRW